MTSGELKSRSGNHVGTGKAVKKGSGRYIMGYEKIVAGELTSRFGPKGSEIRRQRNKEELLGSVKGYRASH